jgi:hypothetical protein
MRAGRIAIVLGLLALVLPGLAAAQGLGDAAARERAKRAKQEAAKKVPVLTNEDLDKGRPPATTQTGGESAPSPAAASAGDYKESPPMEDRFAGERPYLDAIREAQMRLSEVESKIQELGAKLNPMSGSFIYGASGSGSANEEAEVRAQLSQAEGELNEARQAVVAANQALDDFHQGRPSAPPRGR